MYRTLGEISFAFLARIFGEGCHNCNLPVQMNIRRKIIWWKKFFIFVWHWEKKFQLFVKMFQWGCQNWILRVQRIILKKFCENSVFFNLFWTLSEKHWAFYLKNSTGRIETSSACPEEPFEEQQLFKKEIFFVIGHQVKQFPPFGETVLVGYQKLHSTCPKEPFFSKKKHFSRRKYVNFFHFRTITQRISALWRIFFIGIIKRLCYLS